MESKAKQREFFKDYETVIPFLKNVFYYGTKSQDDFADEGICKKSKYSCLKKTLEFAFGDKLTEQKNSKGQKALSFNNDHFYDPHRAFLRFFALKSFTSTERLFQICFILQRIAAESKCTVDDICIGLDEVSEDEEYKDKRSTVRRIINKMTDYGLLIKTGSDYSINVDAKKLNKTELLYLTDLCTNIYPLSVCGSGIQNKIDQHYESPFLFKHIHLGQIFNDELIWKLMVHIYNKQQILVETKKGSKLKDLLPYKIITNRETGRQYLFAIYVGKEDYNEYMMLRLDNIAQITVSDAECIIPDDDVLKEKYDTAVRYSFNGTTILERDKEPETGVLVYDKSFEWNIKLHFPDHKAVPVDELHDKISVKVNSLIELKPWLRRHIDRVQLIESSDGTVEIMRDELKEWREMYGIS